MTKSELIEQVAEKIEGLTKKQTEVIVNEIFDSVKNALASADDPRVEIRGFGSFKVKGRRSREGRNPKTGSQVSISAKRVPVFKAGKELRERVNRSAPWAAAAGSWRGRSSWRPAPAGARPPIPWSG